MAEEPRWLKNFGLYWVLHATTIHGENGDSAMLCAKYLCWLPLLHWSGSIIGKYACNRWNMRNTIAGLEVITIASVKLL